MIARLLLSLTFGAGTDAAMVWMFGEPQSIVGTLCLVGIVGCFAAGAFVVPGEDAT